MGEATEFAVQLFEDAEPIADQDFEHHHANDLFVVPVDEGVRRRRENAAAVAARVLREGLQSETAARDALERDHESLVEQEKLLSKQLSVAKRQVGKLEQLLRQAEAVDERWSDDETTSDRRGLGLVIKREFAPNADAQERPRARRTKRPETTRRRLESQSARGSSVSQMDHGSCEHLRVRLDQASSSETGLANFTICNTITTTTKTIAIRTNHRTVSPSTVDVGGVAPAVSAFRFFVCSRTM